ncbi:hypothetical protein D3C75_842490 [compost metagenome]
MIIIILLCFGLLFLIGAKAIEEFKLDWDALAFVGSIIGGVIGGYVTLLGVKLTLSNQYRSEYLKEYPLKQKYSNDITHEQEKLIERLEKCLASNDFSNFPTYIHEHLRLYSSEFEEKAIIINEDVYFGVRHFNGYLRKWYDLLTSQDNNISLIDRRLTIRTDFNQLKNSHSEVNDSCNKEYNEYQKLKKIKVKY